MHIVRGRKGYGRPRLVKAVALGSGPARKRPWQRHFVTAPAPVERIFVCSTFTVATVIVGDGRYAGEWISHDRWRVPRYELALGSLSCRCRGILQQRCYRCGLSYQPLPLLQYSFFWLASGLLRYSTGRKLLGSRTGGCRSSILRRQTE